MSLTNPDETAENVKALLRPFIVIAVIIGIGIGPAIGLWLAANGSPDSLVGAAIFIYVAVSVAAGLFCYYTIKHRNALAIAAYIVAYVAGLFSVFAFGAAGSRETDDPTTTRNGFIIVGVIYAVALALVFLYLYHRAGAEHTLQHGVDTTATVTGAGVDGMVNYVQHQKLTLMFTDKQGNKRYFHIGRTGGGYSVGDTIPMRYDPDHPGEKRYFVVGQ